MYIKTIEDCNKKTEKGYPRTAAETTEAVYYCLYDMYFPFPGASKDEREEYAENCERAIDFDFHQEFTVNSEVIEAMILSIIKEGSRHNLLIRKSFITESIIHLNYVPRIIRDFLSYTSGIEFKDYFINALSLRTQYSQTEDQPFYDDITKVFNSLINDGFVEQWERGSEPKLSEKGTDAITKGTSFYYKKSELIFAKLKEMRRKLLSLNGLLHGLEVGGIMPNQQEVKTGEITFNPSCDKAGDCPESSVDIIISNAGDIIRRAAFVKNGKEKEPEIVPIKEKDHKTLFGILSSCKAETEVDKKKISLTEELSKAVINNGHCLPYGYVGDNGETISITLDGCGDLIKRIKYPDGSWKQIVLDRNDACKAF